MEWFGLLLCKCLVLVGMIVYGGIMLATTYVAFMKHIF